MIIYFPYNNDLQKAEYYIEKPISVKIHEKIVIQL